MKLVVGISNPSKDFGKTRHNIGSWMLYNLVNKYKGKFIKNKKFYGHVSSIILKNRKIKFLIPDIYMNINGRSVFSLAYYYKIKLSEILIVHDDIDLFPGDIKIKYGNGHGGHNGLRSIISIFKEKVSFYRVRIGIGRPLFKNQVSKYVLDEPSKNEYRLIVSSISKNILEIEKIFFC
ncbi:MAG: aminoacyl-tRNA hydrolase [Buchnera aphidicola (Tetraneura sorini)]